jgi:hypothetical protein
MENWVIASSDERLDSLGHGGIFEFVAEFLEAWQDFSWIS